nr:uncharacterized protein LOC129429181 [Misgurnus anguillicaudatus]
MSVAEGESARVLTAEIETLLSKQAIRVVHEEESRQGFYSRYFVVPKKGGSALRPILDLRILNMHLRKYSFKMLTHKVLCQSIRPNDWFVTIDLSDAYFHIDIYPSHRKFLRFAYRGTAYEFQTIPFGLSLAPRVFTKCVEAALFPLRDRGIRILSYIDDYLICSSSREQAIKDAETVLNHLSDLGFRINMIKSRLVPSQQTAYLGLNLNSLSYRVTLTEERIASFTQCLARFQGKSGSVQAVLANAGAYGFSDRRGTFGASQNEGFPALDRAFTSVLSPASQPTSENRSYVRRSTQTLGEPYDAQDGDSPRGGVVQGNHDDRRIVKGLGSNLNGQSGERRVAATADAQTHKFFGAISSVVSTETLSEFPQWSACFSENRQLHSGCLHQPTGGHTLSSTASVGRETDRVERHTTSISQSNPRSGGFKQGGRFTVQGKPSLRGVETPSSGGEPVMAKVRSGCRRSLRLARKRSMPSVLLSGGRKCTAGCGCSSPPMAKRASVCVSPSELNLPHSSQSEVTISVTNSDSPALAISTLGGRDSSTLVRSAVAPPPTEGPPVSGGGGGNLPSSSRHVSPLGLARERWNLNAAGLPSSVINTIQSARASSTRTLYGNKWRVFEGWCERRVVIPFQCSVKDILCFLQDLLDKGKAFSTIKVYLAAISACHIGFGEKSAGQHPLISRFMKGACRIRPVSKQMVPLWDLPIVLEALSQHPFEPIEAVSLKYLSLKTALLLALVTAKRVSDLHALSVSPSCLQFAPGLTKVSFRPNPAFVPKVMESAYRCPATELAAFHPPPFSSPEYQKLNALCPVRALQVYVERTAGFRTCDQLFVSWATPHIGKPLSRQRLSHWIVEAISVAYSSRGLQPPRGLRAHSTRGMATSWALFRGVSVQDICSAASWATLHTFVRFYRLDVSEPSLAHAVLGAGNSIPILR